jgi:hypothetical protein
MVLFHHRGFLLLNNVVALRVAATAMAMAFPAILHPPAMAMVWAIDQQKTHHQRWVCLFCVLAASGMSLEFTKPAHRVSFKVALLFAVVGWCECWVVY